MDASLRSFVRPALVLVPVAALAFVLPAAAGASVASAPNAVRDGSFEWPKPRAASSPTYVAPQRVGDWRVTAGSIDLVNIQWQAAAGLQSVDLSGSDAGAISQTIATVPGQAYSVRFSMAGNPFGPPAVKRLAAFWDGRQLAVRSFDTTGRSAADMGWVAHKLTVVATGTTGRLEFRSITAGSYGPVLDRVRVTAVVAADPWTRVSPPVSPTVRVNFGMTSVTRAGRSCCSAAPLPRASVRPGSGTARAGPRRLR